MTRGIEQSHDALVLVAAAAAAAVVVVVVVVATEQPDHFCDYAICRVPNCKSQKHVRPKVECVSSGEASEMMMMML